MVSVPLVVELRTTGTAPQVVEAGVAQVIWVWIALTVWPRTAPPPTVTVTVPPNPVPVMIRAVPPCWGPLLGVTLAVGVALYVYPAVLTTRPYVDEVTSTSAGPALAEYGVWQMIWVLAELTVTFVVGLTPTVTLTVS
jgi:hypothetical protein